MVAIIVLGIAGIAVLLGCLYGFCAESRRKTVGTIICTIIVELDSTDHRRTERHASVLQFLPHPIPMVRVTAHATKDHRYQGGWGSFLSMLVIVAVASSLHAQRVTPDDQSSQIHDLKALVVQLQSRVEQLEKERRAKTVPQPCPTSAGAADDDSKTSAPTAPGSLRAQQVAPDFQSFEIHRLKAIVLQLKSRVDRLEKGPREDTALRPRPTSDADGGREENKAVVNEEMQ